MLTWLLGGEWWRLGWLRPPIPAARIRNELAQLVSIRDDLKSRQASDRFVGWCNGAIFALSWVCGERGSEPPSKPAHLIRSALPVEKR